MRQPIKKNYSSELFLGNGYKGGQSVQELRDKLKDLQTRISMALVHL